MLADVAAATMFTVTPPLLVLADAAAATLFTLSPHLLMLADAAAAAIDTYGPALVVLAQHLTPLFPLGFSLWCGTLGVMEWYSALRLCIVQPALESALQILAAASDTCAPHLLMHADAAAAASDTFGPRLLMLADAVAAAIDTYGPALVVLAQHNTPVVRDLGRHGMVIRPAPLCRPACA